MAIKTIFIIGCGKLKNSEACEARDMYRGQLFKSARAYAESTPDSCYFILSAKHGLIEPERVISPYDETIKGSAASLDRAATKCLRTGRKVRQVLADNPDCKVVLLCGKNYCAAFHAANILSWVSPRVSRPLEGMGIGQRLAWFAGKVKNVGQLCLF